MGPVVGYFGELSDTLIAEIRGRLEELLDNAVPKPSLKQYFVEAFGATCADTDHIAKSIGGETGVKIMFGVALLNLFNALEDFTATVEVEISDERIFKAIDAFYSSQGFMVAQADGFTLVTKDGQGLSVKVSNYSATDGYLLVTVQVL